MRELQLLILYAPYLDGYNTIKSDLEGEGVGILTRRRRHLGSSRWVTYTNVAVPGSASSYPSLLSDVF